MSSQTHTEAAATRSTSFPPFTHSHTQSDLTVSISTSDRLSDTILYVVERERERERERMRGRSVMMVLTTISCLSMSNASLSEQECRDLGFERSQLSCESCDVLSERIQDDVLNGECRSCCTETVKGNSVRFQKDYCV